MIAQPLPDLESWVSFFSEAQLPVLRHTVHELDQLRENAENVNGRILAGIILRDPLMALRVLAYIESNRRKSQTTDITTIERALMMIGITPFFRDFDQLPLIEDQLKPHPKALLGLLKVFTRARKAAHWAREWAILRHDLDVDEITIAALLHDFPEILMWCFAPTLAVQVRETQLSDRSLRSVNVQTEVYGIALYQLKAELVKTWRLPGLLSMLMSDENADNPRVRNVKLAVDLARHSANGWDDAALPDDFKAIEELIHIGHDHLLQKLGLDPEQIALTNPNQPQ
jgi:HD-like signal output (HDOD) protein